MAVLVVVGGLLRWVVAGQDLFADELATYWVVSTRGLSGVVETVSTTAEISPPFGFVLSWFTTRIGLSPELVRLPALVAGIASIPLVYAVGRRTVGHGAALVAATLTTLSPFMIFYSAEARGYGVLMALLLLSTLTLLIAVEDGRARWWGVYAVCVCLSAYTHYTAVFVLAAQLGWAFWLHPRARRPLLVSTALAALAFVPWLPSLRADMDSPTTDILSALSPTDPGSIGIALGQWSIGFPAANIGVPLSFPVSGSSLRDLPGIPALVLLMASLGVALWGLVSMRSRLRPWFAEHGGHVGLVVLLAVATPVGAALQSAVGTNVFRTRSLAPSWPYLALAVAALITVGPPARRAVAAALAVAAFGLAALTMTTSDFQRPDFQSLARLAEDHGGVVVNGAAFTPGPLTSFDVEGSSPALEVFRLTVPEQASTPFVVGEARPDPAVVAERAVAAADGGPITVVAFRPPAPEVTELIEHLPSDYELTETVRMPGIFELQALVYERTGGG